MAHKAEAVLFVGELNKSILNTVAKKFVWNGQIQQIACRCCHTVRHEFLSVFVNLFLLNLCYTCDVGYLLKLCQMPLLLFNLVSVSTQKVTISSVNLITDTFN